jgi:uncharacterized protein YqgV (UPF0045/DUF77 family)
MDIGIEISLYPLRSEFAPAIRDFIARLGRTPQLRIETNSMSTQVFGGYEEVMDVLRREVRATLEALRDESHKAVFVMKLLGPLAPG